MWITVEVTSVVTSGLTEEEITNLTNTVLEAFNTSESDVNTEVNYVATGTMDLTVPEGTTEDEVAVAVTSTLAELLNVHPKDITITSVNVESGEVEYEIVTDNYNNTATIQSTLDSFTNDIIEDEIQQMIPTAEVNKNEVEDDVEMDVTITVDGSEAGNIVEANNAVTDAFNNQGFEVETDVAIITAAPSLTPTFTTLVPSPAPSITGIVVSITLTSSSNLLNSSQVDSLEEQLAIDYGVNLDDVIIDATYTVSGSIDIDNIPTDVSNEELEEILEQSIADVLGVHSKNVDIIVDPTSGEVTYTVTTNDDVTAANIQDNLETASFLENLNDEIVDDIPSATVGTMTVEDEIEMQLDVTIDASETNVDLTDANAALVEEFENQGFVADADSNKRTRLKMKVLFLSFFCDTKTECFTSPIYVAANNRWYFTQFFNNKNKDNPKIVPLFFFFFRF